MIATRVEGGLTLPVGKIVAVGRNFADHAREMGVARPTEPVLFLKPSTALDPEPTEIHLPPWSREVHHEVEMVVRIGVDGGPDAVAVGLDLTARDVQRRAKERGEPWAVAKGFDGAAPVSAFEALAPGGTLGDRALSLRVNGEERQRARTSEMVWSVPELLEHVAACFLLEPGDLLFTGTPAGVGPLAPGDRIEARLDPGPVLTTRVA